MKDKIINFWSKHENRVLIYSLLIFTILNIYSKLTLEFINFEPHTMGEYDPDSVVAGYMVLFDASGVFLSVLGIALYYLLIVMLFSVTGLISFIFNIISRLFRLGVYKKWKDIVSKIFFFLSLVPCLLALIGMIYFGFIYLHLNLLLFIITIIAFILVIVISIVSIKCELKYKK